MDGMDASGVEILKGGGGDEGHVERDKERKKNKRQGQATDSACAGETDRRSGVGCSVQ